jgi:hypothetical protein
VASLAIGTPARSAAAHNQSSVRLDEGALAGLTQREGAEDGEAAPR